MGRCTNTFQQYDTWAALFLANSKYQFRALKSEFAALRCAANSITSRLMAVEINIIYEGGLHCTATHGPSRQTLITDAPVDNGGMGAAFSPTDLVATALGTCMATIMGLVARRNNLNIDGLQIQVIKEMTATPVRRIGSLKTRLVFPPGKALSATDRAKLEAAAKACPVKHSLHPDLNTPMEFVYPD
jgi:putative redox protein